MHIEKNKTTRRPKRLSERERGEGAEEGRREGMAEGRREGELFVCLVHEADLNSTPTHLLLLINVIGVHFSGATANYESDQHICFESSSLQGSLGTGYVSIPIRGCHLVDGLAWLLIKPHCHSTRCQPTFNPQTKLSKRSLHIKLSQARTYDIL